MKLSPLTAAALAAALVAAASVLVSAMPRLFVWAAFIGSASYDHSGATAQATMRSSAAPVFGVAMAWAVAIVVTVGTLPLNSPLAIAVAAGVASLLIVLASAIPILSTVPATFYGFCSDVRLSQPCTWSFHHQRIDGRQLGNAIVAMPVSFLIGTCLGIAAGLVVAGACRKRDHSRTKPSPRWIAGPARQ